MHIIWKREREFEDFISGVASKKIELFGGLYVLIAVVESYFEFITRVLSDKIELSKGEKWGLKHCGAINELAEKKRLIDEENKEIFHQVRLLRHVMLHDILYQPDLKKLKEFMQTCFDEKLDPADEDRCKSSPDEIERILCHKVVTAYAKISNKYKHQVDKKIADYLKNP